MCHMVELLEYVECNALCSPAGLYIHVRLCNVCGVVVLTIVGACVVCTVYRSACSLVSAVEYYCALGPAVCKKHISLSYGSCVEMHTTVVLVVYTVDRCTGLGSYGINRKGNAFIDPAGLLKHRNFSRVDGVYMLAGCTIHTVCRNCCSSISFVYSPGTVCILNRGNLTKNVNLCSYALESALNILCNKYSLASLSLCEVICCIEVLANQDCIQRICRILNRTEYIVALLISDLIRRLLPEISETLSKSNLCICVALIYQSIRSVSYLRNNERRCKAIIIIRLLGRSKYQLRSTLYMVSAEDNAIVLRLIPLCTNVMTMTKYDGRRCRSSNSYVFTCMKLVQRVNRSCIRRCAAKNCNACLCKIGNLFEFTCILSAFVAINNVLCAIDCSNTALYIYVSAGISCEVGDTFCTLRTLIKAIIYIRNQNVSCELVVIVLCKGNCTIIRINLGNTKTTNFTLIYSRLN